MMQYAVERFGYPVVARLLTDFRDGKDQPTAFRHVLGISTEQFNSDFKNWAKKQVDAWGIRHTPDEEPNEVQALVEKDPDNPTLLARLAMAQLRDGDADAARKTAARSLELNNDEVLAIEVLAGIQVSRLVQAKEKAVQTALAHQTEPYLRRLLKLDGQHPQATLYLGTVKQSLEEYPQAIELFTRYQRRFPDDPESYRHLAGIYFLQGRRAEALKQLEQLARLSEDEAPVCKQIAGLYFDSQQLDVAARWFRRAIEINPYDASIHREYREVLLKLGQSDAAEREKEALTKLNPDDARAAP